MKIHSRVVIDIASGTVLEDQWQDYTGPVAELKSSTKTDAGDPTPEQQRLQGAAADISQQQLQAILGQTDFQNLLYQLAPSLIQGVGTDTGLSSAAGSPRIGTPESMPLSLGDISELNTLRGKRDSSSLDMTQGMTDVSVPGSEATGQVPGMIASGNNNEANRLAELERRMQSQGKLQPTLNLPGPMSAGPAASPGAMAPVDDELQNMQMDRLRSAGSATPDDLRLINDSVSAQLESGASDISSFAGNMFSDLRQELAPQMGLRPDDSPVLDRGGRIATEAIRQYGNLASSLRGKAADAALQFPLARFQASTAATGSQQAFQQSLKQFQEDLKQRSFTNRAALLQSIGNFGLGLAGMQPTMPAFQNDSRTTVSDPWGALKGVGAGAQGIGSLIAAI